MCFKDDWEKKTHGLPQNIKMNTVYQTPTWYSWWVLIPWQKTASKKFTEKKTQNPGGGRWKDLIDLIAQLHSGNLKKQDWLEMSPDIEEAISTCFMHSCVDLVSLRHVKMTGWYNHQRLYNIDRRWNWSLPQKENHQNLRKMFKTANSQYLPLKKKFCTPSLQSVYDSMVYVIVCLEFLKLRGPNTSSSQNFGNPPQKSLANVIDWVGNSINIDSDPFKV